MREDRFPTSRESVIDQRGRSDELRESAEATVQAAKSSVAGAKRLCEQSRRLLDERHTRARGRNPRC